jgi:tetratricopeptide (TPR) repeat protein
MSGDFDGAEEHLRECHKLQNGPSEASQLENLLMRIQRGEEDDVAKQLFYYIDKEHPESTLILETLARANMFHLRYGPALICLDRWIKLNPDAAKPYHWRAWVLERVTDYEGAMRDYNRALELDPDLYEVRLRVAEIYLERSNPPAAVPHLEILYNRYPDRPKVLSKLGQCRFLQGDVEDARRLLYAAADKLDDDPALFLTLGKLELQDEHPDEAEKWLLKALTIDPHDPDAGYALYSCLQNQGRLGEAATALEKWRTDKAQLERANKILKEESRRPSKDPNTAFEAGTLLLEIGHDRLGVYWLNQALERDPGHQPSLKALVEHFTKKGEPQTAATYQRRIVGPKK